MTDLLEIFVTKRRNIAYHCWVERWLETEMSSARFVEAMKENIERSKARGEMRKR